MYACTFTSYQARINGQGHIWTSASTKNKKQPSHQTKITRLVNKAKLYSSQVQNVRHRAKKTAEVWIKAKSVPIEWVKMDKENLRHWKQVQETNSIGRSKGLKIQTGFWRLLEK